MNIHIFLLILCLVVSSAAPWLWLALLDARPETVILEQLIYWGSAFKWTLAGSKCSRQRWETGRMWLQLKPSLNLTPHGPLGHERHQELSHLEKWRWTFGLGFYQFSIFFVTPWTEACQAPLTVEFSRQEYWSGLPFPFSEDLPNPGIEPWSPALQAGSLPSKPPGKMPLL